MLGSVVKDCVSGFEGRVIGEAVYLFSAPQLLVASEGLKDGSPQAPIWFDKDRMEIVVRQNKVGFMMHKGVDDKDKGRHTQNG